MYLKVRCTLSIYSKDVKDEFL